MSHIINSSEDVKKISLQLEKIKKKGWEGDILGEIISDLIPYNQNVKTKVEIIDSKIPIYFLAEDEGVSKFVICPNALYKQINNFLWDFSILHPTLKKEYLYNFLLLVLLHEIEHYYQYLIAKGYVEFPYQIVTDVYNFFYPCTHINYPDINPLFSLIIEEYLSYIEGTGSCIIERNANIEAFSALIKVADYENNSKMLHILKKALYSQAKIGYAGIINNGSIEQTFRKLLSHKTYKSFNHTEDISLQDRIRYGLPIDEKSKKLLLKQKIELDF